MWIVYGLPDQSVETAAFAEGLRRISQPFRALNHNGFTRGQIEDGATVAFVSGLRRQGMEILRSYNAVGIPVVVCDYGYLRRVSGVATWLTGHWQVGLNRLGWTPPFDCPPDRLAALDVTVTLDRPKGRAVYICGQHDGDPSHGLDKAQIAFWAECAIAHVRERTDRPIVWRPHPDSRIDIPSVEMSAGAIDWNDVHSVVCLNSNIGLEALMNGRPVVCRADAPYAALANREWSDAMAQPTEAELDAYLARVAYAQWTLEEIRCGLPMNWMLTRRLLTRVPT